MDDRRWREPLLPGDVWEATSRGYEGLRARILRVNERGSADYADRRVKFEPIGHGSKRWSKAQRSNRWIWDEMHFRVAFTPTF